MNKQLELARAAIPSRKWTYDEGNECVRAVADDGGMDEDFDPENNPSQAWDVLAWLLTNKPETGIHNDGVYVWLIKRNPTIFSHDGTASGIRRAVVHAAERCI